MDNEEEVADVGEKEEAPRVESAEEEPAVPSAARVVDEAQLGTDPQPSDVTVAVEAPVERFEAYGVTVTQEPQVVPAFVLADLRRSATEAGVTLVEGTT